MVYGHTALCGGAVMIGKNTAAAKPRTAAAVFGTEGHSREFLKNQKNSCILPCLLIYLLSN